MVDRASATDPDELVTIKSDVMIAPHHGGNNGSSKCFIEAVDPTFVVFPAGHAHHHPTKGAAERYTGAGIPEVKNIPH